MEDLQLERQLMNQAKLNFERKKQEFIMFLAQGCSYATGVLPDPFQKWCIDLILKVINFFMEHLAAD